MRATLTLILITWLTILGCAPAKSNRQASNTATFVEKAQPKSLDIEVPKEAITVAPSDLDVVCGEQKCPQQVGLLVFIAGMKNKDGTSLIERCTAFLIAPDMIMSNGHCDFTKDMSGLFIGQKVNGKPVSSAISSLIYKKHSLDAKGELMKSPDVAIFKLQTPITSMPALKLASGPQINFEKLTAYAIFAGDKLNQFKILARECTIHRHETLFPFALSEAPDIIHSFDCKMIQGTSGSPMFAPGLDEVQAVHSANSKIELSAANARKNENRDLMPHEKHEDSVATNVRCLDYPGAKPITCIAAGFDENNNRWQATQRFEMEKLNQREFPGSERYPVQFTAVRQQFKLTSPILEFEMIYIPKCRVQDVVLTSVPFVFERLRLVPDQWASLKVDAQPVNAIDMKARQLSGSTYVIEPQWPAAPGNLLDPEHDHRKLNPKAFRVDLPVCPR